jgi:hypothetical protein
VVGTTTLDPQRNTELATPSLNFVVARACQFAPTARSTSEGSYHPESRLSCSPGEQIVRATGRVGALAAKAAAAVEPASGGNVREGAPWSKKSNARLKIAQQ